MNILQMEDMVKGLPDEMLMQEAQMPSGRIPQFLALSEVQRRKEMRDRFQQPPQATVADQILQGGIASAMPQQPPQGGMAPPQGPPMGPPPGPQGAPVMAYGGGQMPYRMYEGGRTPGTVYMQQGQTVPDLTMRMKAQNLAGAGEQIPVNMDLISYVKTKLPTFDALPPAAKQEVLARFEPMYNQARSRTEMVKRASTDPQGVLAELEAVRTGTPVAAAIAAPPGALPAAAPAAANASAPGVTPDMTLPADAGEVQQPMDMASLFNQISSGMSVGGGRPTNLAQGVKPFEQYFQFDPNAPALQATDLSPLVQQQEKRGAERAASYAETIKNIENEMKRERLGAVLTTLGANLMAGEGALGLEKAGALAQQMGKEARQEIAAERRSARAAEEATADRIFALNAQQLTADKEAQRAIFNAQQNVKEKAFAAFSDKMKNEQQAAQAASQLAATLTVGAVNSMRDKIVTEGANARAVLDFAKEQARSLKDTLGTSTVGMAAADIQKLVEETLISGIITGYKAIGQAPPRGFESQVRAAAATTGGTGGTGAQSGSSRFDVQVVNPGR